jgi:hypothetical protein
MDPDETLRRLRALVAAHRMAEGDQTCRVVRRQLDELVEAIDGWLDRAGFPPARWANGFEEHAAVRRREAPLDFPPGSRDVTAVT